MNYGPIEVTVSPFELKLGLFEAKQVEQAIYITFDTSWSNIQFENVNMYIKIYNFLITYIN